MDMAYTELREMRGELKQETGRLDARLDETNKRIDRLYELQAAQRVKA